jgi:large subunit ribosomal protein L22
MADPKDKNDEAAELEETKAAAEPEETKAAAEPEAKTTDAKAEDKPTGDKPKRRGAAETTTKKRQPARPAPTNDDGVVEVRATARFVRNAPRKARLVMDHIRGKNVSDARAILRHTPRAAATDIAKLLESAVANAENNFELEPDELRIHRATVDEGPTIKRYRPRALGRATPIHKRTSHMTITLTTAENGARGAATQKARK